MTLEDTHLKDFLNSLKPDGNYVVLATERLSLEWAGGQMLDARPGVVINWRRGIVQWPNNAMLWLLTVQGDYAFRHMRGLRIDGALLIYGDSGQHFPPNLERFLSSRAAGPDFQIHAVMW